MYLVGDSATLQMRPGTYCREVPKSFCRLESLSGGKHLFHRRRTFLRPNILGD